MFRVVDFFKIYVFVAFLQPLLFLCFGKEHGRITFFWIVRTICAGWSTTNSGTNLPGSPAASPRVCTHTAQPHTTFTPCDCPTDTDSAETRCCRTARLVKCFLLSASSGRTGSPWLLNLHLKGGHWSSRVARCSPQQLIGPMESGLSSRSPAAHKHRQSKAEKSSCKNNLFLKIVCRDAFFSKYGEYLKAKNDALCWFPQLLSAAIKLFDHSVQATNSVQSGRGGQWEAG